MKPCQTQFNLCSNVWNILMESYVWASDGWLDINIHTNLLNACANYKPKGIYTVNLVLWKMNDKWLGNSFLLSSSSLANHDG
jgi:hypothetical protein